ncbi:MAG TPA: hypothetical protein VFP34_00420 [Microlunatus sp.]|nr:hypothetical protein [Microlunatus sp.]
MPVRTDQRRHAPARRTRLTWTRILGIMLLGVGLLATAISLISVATR